MMRRHVSSPDRHAVADLLVVAVTLLAPVFAAGPGAWPGAVLLAVAAAALWLSPAVRPLPGWVNGALAGFVLCGALGLLPLAAQVQFPWWRELTAMGVALPPTISAQPWLTLQALLSLAAGAAWAWFLLARDWRLPRRLLLVLFGTGALLILVWWLAAAAAGRNLSGVSTQAPFGTFANRNQSANFAALAGVVFAALALDGRLRGRRSWPLWVGALAVAVAAAIASGSRAGVLLLGLGAGGWFFWAGRMLRFSAPVAVLCSGVLLLVAGVLAFGGGLVDRLNFAGRTGGELAADFRLLLYRDALPLLRDAAWHGVGLGNFAGVFARYRQVSFGDNRAIHPDSDWVWFTAEMGWLAPAALAALLGFAFRQCRPFGDGSERVLRAGAMVAGLMFLAHSLVDVPGHRATLWPALLLIGLAASPIAGGGLASPAAARVVAAVLTLAVAVQMALLAGWLGVPTSESVRAAKRAINLHLDRGEWAAAAARATEALRGAPLDWELYFGRASAGVMLGADTRPALQDFAIARYLEPAPRVAFDEGVAWLVRESDFVEANPFIGPRPDLAAAAWSNVFRVPTRAAPSHYAAMLALAWQYPEVRPYLRGLAGDDPQRLALFVQSAVIRREELPEALAALVAASPDLAAVPEPQLRRVLGLWFEAGDRPRLLRELPARPRWLQAGWVYLGEALAAQGEWRRACELARAQVPAPRLPPVPAEPLERLRQEQAARPDDLAAGVRLYQRLSAENRLEEALRVVARLVAHPQAPPYVDWLEADLRERAGDWAGAWAAWRRAGLR